MELKGETRIEATRQVVWDALCDPAILARCIDGVERLDAVAENRFEGALNAKVGPVKARFAGEVELTEMDPPNRYVLVGEGKGGVAGFAKGSAEVVLTDVDGSATLLSYVAKAQVGGKLAQLGTRLIEGTAKGYASSFFERFKQEVEGPAVALEAVSEAVAVPAAPSVDAVAGKGLSPLVWVGALVALVVLILALLVGGAA